MSWSKVPEKGHRRLLIAFANAIESYQDEFEYLLVLEQGKLLGMAYLELNMAILWLRSFPKIKENLGDTENQTIISRYMLLSIVRGFFIESNQGYCVR